MEVQLVKVKPLKTVFNVVNLHLEVLLLMHQMLAMSKDYYQIMN